MGYVERGDGDGVCLIPAGERGREGVAWDNDVGGATNRKGGRSDARDAPPAACDNDRTDRAS